MNTILVVDDERFNRALLTASLKQQGYDVLTAENGLQALEVIQATPIDIVLLDLMMPGMDGFEVLKRLKSNPQLRHIPIIVVSAMDEMDTVVSCIEMGATDHLPKPFNPTLLGARVRSSLNEKLLHDREVDFTHELERRVQEQVFEITNGQRATIFALAKLAEYRDQETGFHLERVSAYCKLLSTHLSEQEKFRNLLTPIFIEHIVLASPLHDIGKVGISDLLLRKPGKLTDEEFNEMKRHTIFGAEALRVVDAQYPGNAFLKMGIEIAESHHEKWDGSGYPSNLAREQIPLSARILAVADVYDALTSQRIYKVAFSHQASCDIIRKNSGHHFDPDLVESFLAIEKEFQQIAERFKES
ncbi:MAG TPA: response regulator [Anaerolineaceae bacterium]|nr:response regulator [Anaerolineaceae bacterium]HPN52193.1 response regulator [Anaerolineaceae bacterium]